MPDILLNTTFNNPLLKTADQIPFEDKFGREDGNLLGSTTDIGGKVWAAISSKAVAASAVISGGKAGIVPVASDTLQFAYVEGAADGVFEITYAGGSGINSQILLLLRGSTTSDFLRITTASNKWILRKRVAGVDTTIGTTAVSATPGQRIRVVLAGASVKVYIDGVLLIDVLEPDQKTGIRYGFGAASAANATPVALWDDISFVIPGS